MADFFHWKEQKEYNKAHFTLWIMFIYRRLTSCFKSISISPNLGQTWLSSITIVYIERSYANRILQVSMDVIIDVFGKRENCESFMGFVHVLITWLYVGLGRLV